MDKVSKQRQKEAQEKADKITSRLAVETVDAATLIEYVSRLVHILGKIPVSLRDNFYLYHSK